MSRTLHSLTEMEIKSLLTEIWYDDWYGVEMKISYLNASDIMSDDLLNSIWFSREEYQYIHVQYHWPEIICIWQNWIVRRCKSKNQMDTDLMFWDYKIRGMYWFIEH